MSHWVSKCWKSRGKRSDKKKEKIVMIAKSMKWLWGEAQMLEIILLKMRMKESNMTIMQINKLTSQERKLHPLSVPIGIRTRIFIAICRKSLLSLGQKLQTIRALEILMRKGTADTDNHHIPMNNFKGNMNFRATVDILEERVVNTFAPQLLVVKWLKWQRD